MNKSDNSKDIKPYESLASRKLSDTEIEEFDFSLVRVIELLIKLDRQQTESKTNRNEVNILN